MGAGFSTCEQARSVRKVVNTSLWGSTSLPHENSGQVNRDLPQSGLTWHKVNFIRCGQVPGISGGIATAAETY